MEMDIKDIVKKVKQIEIRTRKKTEATLMGQYHSAFKGQGMTFSEIRPYQFGDEIRRIEWNKTARFQEPYVKVLEEERELTLFVLIDISESMNYGSKVQRKREYIAEVVASLGFSAAGNQDKVGVLLYADQVYKIIPPQKGRKHVLSILSTILKHETIPAVSNLDAALGYLMNVVRRKSLVFVVSDFQDDFDRKLLRVVSRKHHVLGMRVTDEKDDEIPDVGYALFYDVETGKEVWANTSDRRWRYDFAEAQKQRVKQLMEDFDSSSATLFTLKTGDDYSAYLYRYFQKK